MLDFSHYVTISTSQGRLLQSPPPRAGLLALPAPTAQIAGFLATGTRLPVIEIPESIPPLFSMAEVEAYLKEKTGFRNAEEITAYFDARMAAKKQQDEARLMQHPAFRKWANRRVS